MTLSRDERRAIEREEWRRLIRLHERATRRVSLRSVRRTTASTMLDGGRSIEEILAPPRAGFCDDGPSDWFIVTFLMLAAGFLTLMAVSVVLHAG